jgi:hypothetical protein
MPPLNCGVMRTETLTASSLLALLESGDVARLRAAIAEPLRAFGRGLAEPGRSAPIELATTGESMVVTLKHVTSLLTAHIEHKLSALELRYLANALDISPDARYDSEAVCQAVSGLSSDEEIDAVEVLRELDRGAAA